MLKVYGDGTGLLRIQSNQLGSLERITSTTYKSSKLNLNLELHGGGEFILSETTFLLGLQFQLIFTCQPA